jgi:hypothetical protein
MTEAKKMCGFLKELGGFLMGQVCTTKWLTKLHFNLQVPIDYIFTTIYNLAAPEAAELKAQR